MPPSGITYRHASALAAVVTKAAVSPVAGAGAGAEVGARSIIPTRKKTHRGNKGKAGRDRNILSHDHRSALAKARSMDSTGASHFGGVGLEDEV